MKKLSAALVAVLGLTSVVALSGCASILGSKAPQAVNVRANIVKAQKNFDETLSIEAIQLRRQLPPSLGIGGVLISEVIDYVHEEMGGELTFVEIGQGLKDPRIIGDLAGVSYKMGDFRVVVLDGNVTISQRNVRAKYSVINERTGETIAQGITPNSVVLRRSGGYFKRGKYRIDVTNPDTKAVFSSSLEAKMSKLYLFNYMFFPLFIAPSLVAYLWVDPATGAMWTMRDKDVVVQLLPYGGSPGTGK